MKVSDKAIFRLVVAAVVTLGLFTASVSGLFAQAFAQQAPTEDRVIEDQLGIMCSDWFTAARVANLLREGKNDEADELARKSDKCEQFGGQVNFLVGSLYENTPVTVIRDPFTNPRPGIFVKKGGKEYGLKLTFKF